MVLKNVADKIIGLSIKAAPACITNNNKLIIEQIDMHVIRQWQRSCLLYAMYTEKQLDFNGWNIWLCINKNCDVYWD